MDAAALGRVRPCTHVNALKPSFVGLAEVSCPDVSKGSEFYFDILQFVAKTLMVPLFGLFNIAGTFNVFPAFTCSSPLIGQFSARAAGEDAELGAAPAAQR